MTDKQQNRATRRPLSLHKTCHHDTEMRQSVGGFSWPK